MMKAVIAIVPNVWMMTVTIAATRIVMIRIAAAVMVTVVVTVATKNVLARVQNVYGVHARTAQILSATMTTACFVRPLKEQPTWT
jgi:hypothetical protein